MPREQLFIGHTVCPGFAATVEDFAWWTKTAFHVPGYDYLHEGLNYAYPLVELEEWDRRNLVLCRPMRKLPNQDIA
jgi:hypothetical protein